MDDIKKKFQIVVARFNEDVTWLLPFKNISIIYNKGNHNLTLNQFETIQLENVGRESHTYLYHIITNYENLADKTIFFQGKIDDHKILEIEDYFGSDKIIGKFNNIELNTLKTKIEHFGKYKKDYKNNNMKICNYTPFEWIQNIIGLNIDNIEIIKIIWGANFSVSKELILSKPKIFYENILRHINYHINPEEGHILERSWYLIFNQPYIDKIKIGYIKLKDDFNKVIDFLNKKSYNEIHLWASLLGNIEYGESYKISCTHNINKYLLIKPIINNNDFFINIKGNNDSHVLVEFDDDHKYEIVLGGWNNNKSVIRDYCKNITISSYENKTLNKYEFIKFDFQFTDKIIIKMNNIEIFNIKNFFENLIIKKIKIKSYVNSTIYWDYTDINNNNNKIKLYLNNNINENIDMFYKTNYLYYYIEQIIYNL